jgi:hypothetical protein
VLLTVTVANTGVRPTIVDPRAFVLLDTEGFQVAPTFINRGESPPLDLAYTDPVAPGQEISGAIGYEVLAGVEVASVLYIPARDRLIEVANLGAAATVPPAEEEAATPAADTTGEVDCTGVAEYVQATDERFATAGQVAAALPQLDQATVDDVTDLRAASQAIGQFATEQAAGPVPAIAEEFNAFAVAYFEGISGGLSFLADGLESGDPATQVVALANLNETEAAFGAGDAQASFDAIFAACPVE